jgi:hypothetical protein
VPHRRVAASAQGDDPGHEGSLTQAGMGEARRSLRRPVIVAGPKAGVEPQDVVIP